MPETPFRPIVLVPRSGTTEELADAVQASFITRQSLHIDGGMVMP